MTTQPTSLEFQAALLDAALSYIKRGLPTFPIWGPASRVACSCPKASECPDIGKHPLGKLVPHGLSEATTDELAVRRWWKAFPRANVGIALPSGYAVLDIDGMEGLEAIAAEGWKIPDTATAQTARGFHYWFKTTTDIRPGSDFMEHVDMRGPGGYVVAPPSMHRTTTLYEWDFGHALGEIEVAAAPDWLYELAKRPSRKHAQALGKAGINMAEMLQGVNEGSRDWDIFRVASKLRKADVPYEMAVEICTRMAFNCRPPETEEKAREKVDSAYGRYQPTEQLDSGQGKITLLAKDAIRVELISPSGPVEFTFTDMQKTSFDNLETNLVAQLLQPGTALDTYRSRVNLLSHNSREGIRREMGHVLGLETKALTILFNRAIQEAQERFLNQPRAVRVSDIAAPTKVEYIVEDFVIDSERPSILFGPGGSLKTFILYSLLLAIAAGRDWLGRRVQKRNCLLIDYETGQGMAGYRLRMLARALGLEAGLQNIHWWDPDGIPLHDLGDPIRRDIEALNIGFIGMDHCAAACGVEPERSEAATRIQRVASRWKVPSVFLAHVTGNIADNPEDAKRPFGSVFWENMASLTWFVKKEEQDENSPLATVGLFQRKWNDTGRLKDFSLTFEFSPGQIDLFPAELRDSTMLRQVQGLRWVIWDAIGAAPMTVEDIGKATDMGPMKVRATLNRYKAMFEIVPGDGPRLWQRKADYVVLEQDRNSERNRGRNNDDDVTPERFSPETRTHAHAGAHAPSGGEGLLRPPGDDGDDGRNSYGNGESKHLMSLRDGVSPPVSVMVKQDDAKNEPAATQNQGELFDTDDEVYEPDTEVREATTNGQVYVQKPGDDLPW